MKWEGGKEKKTAKIGLPHNVRHTDAHALMHARAHAYAWKHGITFFSILLVTLSHSASSCYTLLDLARWTSWCSCTVQEKFKDVRLLL